MSFRRNDPDRVCATKSANRMGRIYFLSTAVERTSGWWQPQNSESQLKALITVNGGEDLGKFDN